MCEANERHKQKWSNNYTLVHVKHTPVKFDHAASARCREKPVT